MTAPSRFIIKAEGMQQARGARIVVVGGQHLHSVDGDGRPKDRWQPQIVAGQQAVPVEGVLFDQRPPHGGGFF